MTRRRLFFSIAIPAFTILTLGCAPNPAPSTPRLYVFENGSIRGLDPKLFNFTRAELKEVDFTNTSYLVVHPKGTLMFDSGAIEDSHFKDDGAPVTEDILSATKPLLPQLALAGYKPADITFFAMSHYHSDHTANANAFAGATWIVQKAERDFMFSENPQGIIRTAHFSALKGAKTQLLNNEEFDVFGDGTVVIKPTPGHTPGHQVLFVRLAKTGPILLAGDLYHYPEERTTGRVPTFEFNVEQSKASRAAVEAFIEQTKAQLWIEHDIATHAKLPKPPGYLD
jgi:glyoxylase-like metal-dependent hydrolase (beta-lactamase superfamily II)